MAKLAKDDDPIMQERQRRVAAIRAVHGPRTVAECCDCLEAMAALIEAGGVGVEVLEMAQRASTPLAAALRASSRRHVVGHNSVGESIWSSPGLHTYAPKRLKMHHLLTSALAQLERLSVRFPASLVWAHVAGDDPPIDLSKLSNALRVLADGLRQTCGPAAAPDAARTPAADLASTKRQPGHPLESDPAQDRALRELWEMGGYKTHADLARELGWEPAAVELALERHRKRQAPRTRRQRRNK